MFTDLFYLLRERNISAELRVTSVLPCVYFAPSKRCHGTRFSQMNGLGLSSRGSAPLSIYRFVGVRSDHASG